MRQILTSVLLVAGLAGSAAAADYGPAPAYSGWQGSYIPACDAPSVGARIVEKFAYQDAHIIHSGVGISSLSNVRQTAVGTPWQGRIDRRFCSATAWLSDGKKAEAVYVIEGPHLGTFSVGWHVESCVTGRDPWRIYDALCRSIRP